MDLIPHERFTETASILQALDYHLAVRGILAGTVPAEIYVDDLSKPQTVLACHPPRYYLAGAPAHPGVVEGLGQILRAQSNRAELYLVFYAPDAWENLLDLALHGQYPFLRKRQYYAIDLLNSPYPVHLPEGIELASVDADLLARSGLEYIDDLLEEMCSERPTPDDFLQKSFGLVPIHEGKIIGWCLSEYNTEDCCEIGIATRPEYQRRGLATALTLAFLNLARQRGLKRVGWDCWKDNVASARTALKAGLKLEKEYPIYFGFYDLTVQYGVHGNLAFDQDHFPVALSWYEKGIRRGDAPSWLLWNALCAAARSGKTERAFELIHIGLAQGAIDPARLQDSEDLASLRELPKWNGLFR